MRILHARDYDHMSRQAANIISAQIILKPDCVLGLATGSSPIGTYRQLVSWYKKGDLDFSQVRTFNLDEYENLDISSDQSYIYFMHHNLFDYVNIDTCRIGIPHATGSDPEKECRRYDEWIRSLGGIDLQLLGIGLNGHIGFNEPGDSFLRGTHLVELTDSTIQANKRFFAGEKDVPRRAYTMGVYDIIQAKRIVMIASGAEKADIIREAFFGPVTPRVPASILQLHRDFTLVADEAALSKLP